MWVWFKGIIDRFILNKTVTVTAGRITNLEKLFSRLVRRNGIRGFYRELEFQFGPNNFKAEENKIFLNDSETGGYTNNYQFDGIIYDYPISNKIKLVNNYFNLKKK